jgi:hypothetical protein
MYDDATPLRPDQIVTAIVNGLTPWAGAHKARISIARDPFEVLELLGADTPGLRLVVHWGGDDPLGDQMQQAPLVTTTLEIIVGLNLGLTATPDKQLLTGSASRPALYQLISDLRAAVLAIQFPNLSTTGFLSYAGTHAMTAPDGIPLAAYSSRYTLEGALPMPPGRNPASFSPPVLQT